MGKKFKKKTTQNVQKEKQFSTSSPRPVSQKIIPTTVIDGVPVVKEAKVCPHLDTEINLDKISSKMTSLESLKCDDCREGVVDRRASKGKGKHNKKKGGGSKSDAKFIWVCLECGYFTCGGVGFPTTPQSHAARHAKQNRHPLVVQFANPNLRWCFPCNTLIPVKTSEENGGEKDVLSEVVKVLKARASSETSLDVEDVWFGSGSGSVTTDIKLKSVNTVNNSENSDGYMVRGLVNFGNTCFFNSVLQNLLAMGKLRDYFLRLDEPFGPLTISLKKLFVETNPSKGAKNVLNPRSFFSCLCAMAPQFKGYQQHDSHELLRCLLDGLCNEESGVRKRVPSDEKDSTVSKLVPTFVDAIFGGQISSTVTCLECGYASIVYEPYLDLSLPLPTKKSPSKRAPSVSRSKKQKPPPKRRPKIVTKVNKTSDTSHTEKKVIPSSDSTESESVVLGGGTEGNAIEKISEITDNLALLNHVDNPTVVDSCDSSSWLDYLDPTTVSNDNDTAACVSDDLVHTMEESKQVDHVGSEETPLLANDSSWLDYLEPSSSSNDNNIMSSHNEHPSVIQDSGNGNDVFWEDEPQLKVQDSEILLLPYEKLNSTSNNGNDEEPSDFDGFGGLFDEPEVVSGPAVNLFSTGVLESSNMVTNSESDPDEVDNSDSPVSVDKCLAYFTTSELLTKTEHAWHCEQCLKALLEQKMKLKNKLQEPVSNGAENEIPSVPFDSSIKHSLPNGHKNENSGPHSDCTQVEESGSVVDHASSVTASNEESCAVEDTDSCCINKLGDKCKNVEVQKRKSKRLAGKHDLNGVEDDEVDSGSVKVARDASKRILINRVPPILTVHLKRFGQDARGRSSKLNGHVDFRETIDLKPYMDPSCSKDRGAYKYRLVGVVEHLGTMRGGHYVAYVRGGNDDCLWYHASDAYVHEVSLEEVLRSEAYILFYEQM